MPEKIYLDFSDMFLFWWPTTREYWHDQNSRNLILDICDQNEVR